MLDFFIALFGGIFYGAKYLSDKSAGEAADKQIKNWVDTMKSDHDKWLNQVTDSEMEKKIKQRFSEGVRFPEASEVATEIVTKAREFDYWLPNKNSSDLINMIQIEPHNFELIVIMAKRGKLPFDIAFSGLSRPCGKASNYWDAYNLWIEWLDKELQSHGIEEMLWHSDCAKKLGNGGIKELAKDAHGHGRYFWYSNRFMV